MRPNATARVLDMLGTMRIIRAFDEASGDAANAGRVRGPVHQYTGQEAIAVGVCTNLRADDCIASSHRGHGHAIAKGADPRKMMLELFGRAGGTCGGKGGSMHIADFSVGMLGANGVVADGVTIAVGAAHAFKLLRQPRVAVAFFGDGAMNRGPLMEALNWAQVYKLPIVFMCEDNRWSATTHTIDVTAGNILDRARAFGMPVHEVDGNDVVAVDASAAHIIETVRNGGGPAFLYAKTYRWRGHLAADTAGYRKADLHAERMADDPIRRCEAWLLSQGVSAESIAAVDAKTRALIAQHIEDAENAPLPDIAEAWTDIQDADMAKQAAQ